MYSLDPALGRQVVPRAFLHGLPSSTGRLVSNHVTARNTAVDKGCEGAREAELLRRGRRSILLGGRGGEVSSRGVMVKWVSAIEPT
jgi:hypothetical protein